MMLTAPAITQRARELGFDLCGVAPAAAFPELANFEGWLARGYAGGMDYLEKSAHARADIRHFLPTARSVIVVAANYNSGTLGASGAASAAGAVGAADVPADAVRVARYARGRDYHKVLEDRLFELVEWMRAEHEAPFDAKVFVDKHHVQERVHAYYAGLGWVGKNTCLIHPDVGSWLFLAGVAVSLELPPDRPQPDQCGACTLCIDACPTGALIDSRELDATKCISYLTIEAEGSLSEADRLRVGRHAYGCDICQDVCPWNLAAPVSRDPAWQGPPRDGRSAAELWQLSDEDLHEVVKGSAMTYIPLSRLRRNLVYVMANAGTATPAVLERPGRGVKNAARSAETPAVQEAVAWARRQSNAEGKMQRAEDGMKGAP